MLQRDTQQLEASGYYDMVDRLQKYLTLYEGFGAAGVIIFASDQEVSIFMAAVRDKNMTYSFHWIGSDGWGGREMVYKATPQDGERGGKERVVEGAVTVQPLAEEIVGFKEYFLSLTPTWNVRNPWFTEFWEDYFGCSYPGGLPTPFNQYAAICDERQRMNENDAQFSMEAQLQYVSDAVMAFAKALQAMKADRCNAKMTTSICIEELKNHGSVLLNYLRHITFTGLTNSSFTFTDKTYDGPPRYRVLNFQQTPNGQYAWINVGTYQDKKLSLDWTRLRFRGGSSTPPVSSCQPQCDYRKRFHYVKQCNCRFCMECGEYDYIGADRRDCRTCAPATLPSADRRGCQPIPLEHLSYSHPIAIGTLTFATAGAATTLFIIGVFIHFRETAVVKAAGRELSFLLLVGILMCYLMTFVLCTKPTDFTCGVQKFSVGFSFSVCYAALLVKTNRIERIFRAGKKSVRRPRFISPISQVVMTFAVISVQVVIQGTWLYLSPPRAIQHFPKRDKNQLVCLSLIGGTYMLSLIHPSVLILICTVYAFLTRNIPEAFNESQHIGFTMYSTCVIWLGFIPCYFTTESFIQLRVATLCISISLSATIALMCLFAPKVFIILCRPERNVRQSMAKSQRRQSTSASVRQIVPTPHIESTVETCRSVVLRERVDFGTQSDPLTCVSDANSIAKAMNGFHGSKQRKSSLLSSFAQTFYNTSDDHTQTSSYSLRNGINIDSMRSTTQAKILYVYADNPEAEVV